MLEHLLVRKWDYGHRLSRVHVHADDAKRFQEAATAFELANPGWFERRHEWKQPRRAPGAKRAGPQRAKTSPKRPRPALTPWKAFLKVPFPAMQCSVEHPHGWSQAILMSATALLTSMLWALRSSWRK